MTTETRQPFQPRSKEEKEAAFKEAAEQMKAWAEERRKANARDEVA